MTIKELREGCKMTLAAFSKYFGIPYRTVQDWDAGRRTPPVWVIELIQYKLKKEGLL